MVSAVKILIDGENGRSDKDKSSTVVRIGAVEHRQCPDFEATQEDAKLNAEMLKC